jgi:tetratricopeptide (TPR) repeat protein
MGNMTVERIKQLAEFADVAKTEHWYAGLAWIMMEGKYFEPAMEHFRTAIDMNSMLWVAMEGLARCLGDLYRYEEAISWMNKALDSLPENLQFVATYFWPRISDWKLQLGDIDGAIESSKTQYELNRDDFWSITNYVWTLHYGRRSLTIVDLVKELDERESDDFTRSLLVQLISYGRDFFVPVGLAGVSSGSTEALEIMRAAIDDSIIAADTDTDVPEISVSTRIKGADFNYRYLGRIDEAMTLWEAALQFIAAQLSASGKNSFMTERSDCSSRLAEAYFNKAVSAKKIMKTIRVGSISYKGWLDSGPWRMNKRSFLSG